MQYGIGWAYGDLALAPVTIAGVTVPSQALLDVSSAANPVLSSGGSGIAGLGFTALSTIDYEVNKTGASYGRSLLYNAFQADKTTPNFIAFALQRTDDPTDDVTGSFSIGEYEPAYASVANEPKIPTWPVVDPQRWTILLDSFIVGSQTVSVSTNVSGAPTNKAVVLVDSGTSYTYCTQDAAQAIYGGVSGAHFDDSLGQWVVPCDAEIDLALQFGGKMYPVHPLDVVPNNPSNPLSCVGSFVPQAVSVSGGTFDWLMGDNVLRSVYSVYDFGDFDSAGNVGNPYVQLYSLIPDPDAASQDFHAKRGGAARTGITYNASNSTTPAGTTGSGSGSGSGSGVSVTDKVADNLSKIVDYIPAMLGLLGLNALVLMLVAVVGICFFVRRRRTGGGAEGGKNKWRKNKAKAGMAPMPLSRAATPAAASSRHSYVPVDNDNNDITMTNDMGGAAPHSPGYHQQQFHKEPEDMPFEPPVPAFHALDGDTLRPLPPSGGQFSMFSTASGGYPQARGSLSGVPGSYRVSAAGSENTVFVPPTPGYLLDGKGGDRPKSIA
ncbi:acid protease [Rickenella mellea]|uniref:Acid protease n=1 Tax=Rickenella mellea TaxID=50990 RepID=A0A4R5XHG8_9AGAM|nr:acid protease [Rickenella mellea]